MLVTMPPVPSERGTLKHRWTLYWNLFTGVHRARKVRARGGIGSLRDLPKGAKGEKRAGALVNLRQHGFLTPLPSKHQPKVCSMAKKTDDSLLLNSNNPLLRKSAAPCSTNTWLSEHIHRGPGFQLLQTDCVTELSGKRNVRCLPDVFSCLGRQTVSTTGDRMPESWHHLQSSTFIGS